MTAPRLVAVAELRELLSLSRSTIEIFVAAGMPCVDISSMPDPDRVKPGPHRETYRRKRALRFDSERCRAWLFEHRLYSPGPGNGRGG